MWTRINRTRPVTRNEYFGQRNGTASLSTVRALRFLEALRRYWAAPSNGPLEYPMPRGDKTKYTDKQKRQAGHITESYEEKGVPAKDAEGRAWATVNKVDGGGKKSGSGRGAHPAVAASHGVV